MMYKMISRHQLKHLRPTPLDSEEKFIDVNHWLSLHKSAGIKGVIKYTNDLPPLIRSKIHLFGWKIAFRKALLLLKF